MILTCTLSSKAVLEVDYLDLAASQLYGLGAFPRLQ